MQLRLFSVILSLTAAAIVMMVQYNLVLERTHDLAVLKLIGASTKRLVLLVLQEGWLLGAAGYLIAFIVGQILYPHFPRRVLLTPEILWLSPVAIFLLTTLASIGELIMEAVVAQGISKTFGKDDTAVLALQDVNLSLQTGTVAALLGPSGAGKSTLIKALGLVSPPDQGTIIYKGQAVVDNGHLLVDVGEFRRKHVGFVFQKANLVSFLTAVENVEVACQFGGNASPRKRAMELLDYLEVSHRAHSYPETLSGGEQQRVAIARALANAPSLLLADEPTAALDSKRGHMVMQLFRRVAHEQGAAVLVVTHDHRSLDVFDVLYEMEDGRASLKATP